ncbi:MAG: S-adenosylmethionine:tRNA ribosyltransferase-isomerase, partial [Flavobacteriia bacterium]|nr:S-adenosylmethionine:tRNA ribosyltransferase-isomerase [Flavobacteriia bacterium]
EVFCIDPFETDIESAMSAMTTVTFKCMVGNAKKWKDLPLVWKDEDGQDLLTAEKEGRDGGTFIVKFTWSKDIHFAAILEELGHMPLPPYMTRSDEPEDSERYQTVYATRDGSVAAPTAGLHFTKAVLQEIEEKGSKLGRVILHVGAGTFKPVSSDTMEGHEMHSEALEVSRDIIQKIIETPRVTAVGTTSTRTLESLYWLGVMIKGGQKVDMNRVFVDQWVPYESDADISVEESLGLILKEMSKQGVDSIHGRTQIIIAPGYTFKLVKRLITNFHQPGSTLILLVAAAIGESWKEVYGHALKENYRFLSYGDSSLLHIS